MTERNVSFSIARFPGVRRTLFLVMFGLLTQVAAAHTTVFSREQDVVDLKLGQRVRIDDGTCPAGQIKEISGTKMTTSGVVRARKCIPRLGPKQK